MTRLVQQRTSMDLHWDSLNCLTLPEIIHIFKLYDDQSVIFILNTEINTLYTQIKNEKITKTNESRLRDVDKFPKVDNTCKCRILLF